MLQVNEKKILAIEILFSFQKKLYICKQITRNRL
jgi:hypothetical protein